MALLQVEADSITGPELYAWLVDSGLPKEKNKNFCKNLKKN
jgi:hypothetical protein